MMRFSPTAIWFNIDSEREVSSMIRVLLVVSLSINIFVFSSWPCAGTWLATGFLSSAFWRGITSLFVWISTFGAGSVAFWRIIEKISASPTAIKAGI